MYEQYLRELKEDITNVILPAKWYWRILKRLFPIRWKVNQYVRRKKVFGTPTLEGCGAEVARKDYIETLGVQYDLIKEYLEEKLKKKG